jgi:5-methylcytosine-specific restriction endonuclease McrA
MTQKGQKLEKYDNCIVCGKPLTGRQRKYCCKACKDKHERSKNPSYKRQRQRGIDRKLELIKLKGGCCEKCGYSKNLSALTFHHINPDDKSFNVEMRNIANHEWGAVLEEVEKCQLLCHNCHHETHHPDLDMQRLLEQ